jgi:branched-chain amino acid aminotransferase
VHLLSTAVQSASSVIEGIRAVDSPIETWVAAWPWGAYLGAEALEKGVDVCTSSWARAAPNTFPVAAKAAGHYNAAQLMKAQAVADGYAEAIALGPRGLVSEGSGQNRQGMRLRAGSSAH